MTSPTSRTSRTLRKVLTGGVLTGVMLGGLAIPAEAAGNATAACSSFKRGKIISKVEIRTPLIRGELKNITDAAQTLHIERAVSNTKTTSKEFRADWEFFAGFFRTGLSRTVTEEHTISGLQRFVLSVPANRTYEAVGYAVSYRVETEVTTRSSSCAYNTRRITGEVATADDMKWEAKPV